MTARNKRYTYDPILGKGRKSDYPSEELEDIYRRIEGKAPINHNHTGTYAPANHNHDGRYALLNHNHDNDYQPKGNYAPEVHNHDERYALTGHNHDNDYQPKGSYAAEVHTHNQYLTQQDISDLQNKNDNSLNTNSKNVIGAINELLAAIQNLPSRNEIMAMINSVDTNANYVEFETNEE